MKVNAIQRHVGMLAVCCCCVGVAVDPATDTVQDFGHGGLARIAL